jgi:hypothetical protein
MQWPVEPHLRVELCNLLRTRLFAQDHGEAGEPGARCRMRKTTTNTVISTGTSAQDAPQDKRDHFEPTPHVTFQLI